jgi:hypothetical protein
VIEALVRCLRSARSRNWRRDAAIVAVVPSIAFAAAFPCPAQQYRPDEFRRGTLVVAGDERDGDGLTDPVQRRAALALARRSSPVHGRLASSVVTRSTTDSASSSRTAPSRRSFPLRASGT